MSPANFHGNKPLPCRKSFLLARVDDQRKRLTNLLSTKKKQFVIQLNGTTRISRVQTTIDKASRNVCFNTGHQSSKSLVDARTIGFEYDPQIMPLRLVAFEDL
eukprot:4005124-Amphidinium_carterae.1